MSTPRQEDGYNFIYSKLVEDPDDMLGIIAYSFYKQQKIEFVRAIGEREGRGPTDEELRVFYVTSNSPASLSSYRTKAEALSREFVDTVLAEQLREMQEDNDRELLRRMEAYKPSFLLGVWQNILASVSFVFVIGVVLFIAWSVKFGPTEVFKHITGYEIQGPPPPAPPAQRKEAAPTAPTETPKDQ